MPNGIWILGDQLSKNQAALLSCAQNRQDTPVILIESRAYVQQRPYHRQKLVLVWSAMRHFAEDLKEQGWSVTYEIADHFAPALKNWVKQQDITQLWVMTPSDRPFINTINQLDLDCKITFIPNNLFLWSTEDFNLWAKSRKRLLMEDFYREGRKRFNILIEGNQPVGGQWNLDKQNRKPPKTNLKPPKAFGFEPDQMTQEVIDHVKTLELPSYGEIEPFRWGVTRQQALEVLDYFITTCLTQFGPFQDAMVTLEKTLWHSLISPYLNIGLLNPLEVIHQVEKAYYEQDLPLNSVEGFIRQVLGWREYMHGIYHHVDDNYPQNNWFNHSESLPKFYWDSSQTDLNCLQQILKQVEQTGYAHHIQRLMVLNNFALIAGVSPQEIENWFHAAFIDGYDWVMQTNVIGMGQFADGGLLASKPYAASANYIDKMSDYCSKCKYNQRDRFGEQACPFNVFYWDFLARHYDQLKNQGRMTLILANLKRFSDTELNTIRSLAQHWREKLRKT